MSSALVTGATGFLGSQLCRELTDDGWSVTALRRHSSDVRRLQQLDLSIATADILDAEAVRSSVAGTDYVFHLAGLGLLDATPKRVLHVNVEGTRNVLDACTACDVERVLFTSTAGTRRRENALATETDFAEPVGAYQTSKARAEVLVDEYVASGGDAVTVHPTSAFGPGDERFTARLLTLATNPKMVAYLPGGASIVSVRDIARGHVAAMTGGTRGGHYILGGENLSYETALEILAHLSDGTAPSVCLPPSLVHLAGRVIGPMNDVLGTRLFPGSFEMAKLTTRKLFYSSVKAERDFGYDFRPFREHSPEAIEWYLGAHG
ncbi:NAD-dependent epimerase/dehydratase family protein [Halorarius litoreus]|uniref:NAD-dependent epimerase/dehydratase family protein n=1 Tax=Halorarius litoreus TaxID=2962676 RepID=UPI0020CFA27C|nr:NAD-dependent epimerase/dehydratase family protein [Halorarius litoreus]